MASGSRASGQDDPFVPFCDADTMKPEIVKGFNLWSSRLVEVPKFENLHECLELKLTDQLGTHMLARKSYAAGDLVLSERALMRVPESSRASRIRQEFESRFSARSGFMLPAVSVDWANVPKDAQKAAVTLFWAHPLMVGEKSNMVQENMAACTDLIQWYEPLRGRWDARGLMTFLHIVDLNIHKDDEEPQHGDFSGIFVLGSKFTHSCAPNCTWGFSPSGCLQYRAIRPIAAGEIMTFSYVGNGMNLVSSTLQRRHRLASLWFCCQCTRCKGPDLARQMRCPKCSTPKCLPRYQEKRPDALWTGEKPLRDLIPDADTWHCEGCGADSASSQMALSAEEEFTRCVPDVMRWGPDTDIRDTSGSDEMRSKAAKTVGTMHWTWVLLTFAWLQKWLVRLRAESVIAVRETPLREASAALGRWFKDCAPDNMEQRLSALFLTCRLAHILGGDLQSWGYDPADPLNDGGPSAGMLDKHGWQFTKGEVVGADEVQPAQLSRRRPMLPSQSAGPRPLYRSKWA